jgi:hypothetical protein
MRQESLDDRVITMMYSSHTPHKDAPNLRGGKKKSRSIEYFVQDDTLEIDEKGNAHHKSWHALLNQPLIFYLMLHVTHQLAWQFARN